MNLQKMKTNIDEPLIIILTLNTIAHTVGAILVGVQAKEVYSSLNNNSYEFFGIFLTEDIVVGIVSSIMTVLILLVSEIIPKTLGATYWHKLVRFTSIFLNSIIPLFRYSGISFLLQFFTRLIGKSENNNVFTREDFMGFLGGISELTKEGGRFSLRSNIQPLQLGTVNDAFKTRANLGAIHLGYEPNDKWYINGFVLGTRNTLDYNTTNDRIFNNITLK